MFIRDIVLISLGVIVTILVLNHPKVFELYVRLKAESIYRAAENAVERRTLERVFRAFED